jgi:prefoldin subunit 5
LLFAVHLEKMDTALQAGVHQTATPQALEALEREVNAIIERLQQKSANTEASQNLVLQHNVLLQQQVQQLQQQLEQQQQQQQAQTGTAWWQWSL